MARRAPVVEVGERAVLRDEQEVDAAVVVQVAHGQAAADPRDLPGRPRAVAHVGQLPSLAAEEELGGHGVGDLWPEVVHVTIGDRDVKVPVVVNIHERGAKTEPIPRRNRQPDHRGVVGEDPASQVVVEGHRLVVEVGDPQIGSAIAVEVAARNPHPRLEAAFAVAGETGTLAKLLELQVPEVTKPEVGRLVVGHEEVNASVVVEVGGDHPQSLAMPIIDSGSACHIDKSAAIVAKQMIRHVMEALGRTVAVSLFLLIPADLRVLGIPLQVVADVKVQVAIAIQVGEGGRSRPVPVSPSPASMVTSRKVPSPWLR